MSFLQSRGIVPIMVFILSFMAVGGPLHAQHVPGVEWKQRETEGFILIYPESLSDDAARLAGELDSIVEEASRGLKGKHSHRKWPLVLTDLGLESNAFVSLIPRRSVWYATPGEDFTAVSDWWRLLAVHEGRHMGQVDAADQGFTRFLRVLFGDVGWGAGLLLGTPRWLIEGDAVSVETRLSDEGRGRDPLFTQELKALLADNPGWSYNRVVNPSFRNHHTDPYRFGYSMAEWIRDNYGEEAMGEIFRRAARIGIPVTGLNIGASKATRRLPRQLFREMAREIVRRAEEERSAGSWTPGEVVSSESGRFTRYDPLLVDSRGDVFVRRIGQARSSRLVRIGDDGKEVNLMRLPKGGRVSMAELFEGAGGAEGAGGKEARGYRVVWEAVRRHPVFRLGVSVSDVNVVELDSRGRVRGRRRPVKGSRLRYPSISPDGERIAAVDILRGGGSAVVVLDARSGSEIHRLALPYSTAAYPSWSPDGERLVFSRRSEEGREITEWVIGESAPERRLKGLTAISTETVKRPVYSADGKTVYFSSNAESAETVQAVSAGGGQRRTAARRWYGAYDPMASPDGEALYLVEYASSKGERLLRIEIEDLEGGPADRREGDEGVRGTEGASGTEGVSGAEGAEGAAGALAEGRSGVERGAGAVGTSSAGDGGAVEGGAGIRKGSAGPNAGGGVSTGEFPESDYRPARHALNVHSWGLTPDPFNTERLSLSVTSQDVLGTLTSQAGASYDATEKVPRGFVQFSFTGIRPIITFRTDYRYRPGSDTGVHGGSGSVSLSFPMNLGRSGIWKHSLGLGARAGVQWNQGLPVLPILYYSARWERLRSGSDRAFRPEWGWRLNMNYGHVPFSGVYRDAAAADLKFYLPGGFRNTSLQLSGGIERRTVSVDVPRVRARGYKPENAGSTLLAGADYEFPLLYPDVPLGAVVYIQRFRLGVFADFAWIGNAAALGGGGSGGGGSGGGGAGSSGGEGFERRWSAGAVFTIDFAAFNSVSGLSVGFCYSWLWQENSGKFEVLLQDLRLL